MKQCVHEYVLTQKFIPSYWSHIYHHRDCLTRSQNTGEYKNPHFIYNADKTECLMKSKDVGVVEDYVIDLSNITDVSDNPSSVSISDHVNLSKTVDNGDNVSAIHSNLVNKNKTSVLKHNDFMDIASKLSNACQRNKKYGLAVGAIMLEMLEVCEGKKTSDLNIVSASNSDEQFSNIIRNYQSSFKSVTDVRNRNNHQISLPQKALDYQHASSKRLIPLVEQVKIKARNQKTQPISMPTKYDLSRKPKSCTFCKGSNHLTNKCPLKESCGITQDGTQLMKYLTKSCPFSILAESDKDRIMTTDISCQISIKHVIVHMLHSKISNFSNHLRSSEEDLAVTVTFLDA